MDGTRKSNIYNLSMIVIIVVDSLGILIPDVFYSF